MNQEEVLSRGVETILPSSGDLAQRMKEGKIRLYLGIDPTGNQLHLGHSVVLRKLQQFADLGHEVILLIGNGTVKIGDPTGRDKTRPILTDEQIEENFATWKDQASKILDFSKITVMRNGDWLDKLTFAEVITLCSRFTIQQLMERDMFQERLKNNLPIFSHEVLYPIMQGYDSVVMDVDLEIGGSDQLFNMMVGRQLQRDINNREKFVLGVPLLVGSDGRKMGKSFGNFISLTETPENMYGKVMSIVDSIIIEYFQLLTNVPQAEITEIEVALKNGANPLESKKRLAFEITKQYHDESAAVRAEQFFESTVQEKKVPENIPVLLVSSEDTLLDIVMKSEVPQSRSEGRRLIEQGGVHYNDNPVKDPFAAIPLSEGKNTLRVGKRNYFALQSA